MLSPAGFLAQLNVHQGLYHAVASAVGASAPAAQPDSPPDDGSLPSTGTAAGAAAAAGSTAHSAAGSAAGTAGVPEPLPPAAQRVGRLLLQDFEANGVHLQDDAQACFLAASAREQMLCMQFGGSADLAAVGLWAPSQGTACLSV
jgi:hypothetical protein